MAKENTSTTVIFAIRADGGRITSYGLEIIDTFKHYYEKLSAQGGEVEGEMWDFFRDLKTPCLTEEDRGALDAPIGLEEVRQAMSAIANQKSPRLDGLPAEIYESYKEILLPELLKTFNGASVDGVLPLSMRESTIIALPKEGTSRV